MTTTYRSNVSSKRHILRHEEPYSRRDGGSSIRAVAVCGAHAYYYSVAREALTPTCMNCQSAAKES